ncbi:hypothetical protein MPDQ_003094 [Monascus purpureus]|uniref:FCP1 homology domain-containing protein n=1 Tax=Monascus purpureus TaxID=5098 RepID=A0A507QZB1_MONPU|nr:hypothetical protein MPDQ_003094 [Monascus purpureus]
MTAESDPKPGSSRQENVNGRDSSIPEHSNSPESAGPNSPPSVSVEGSETAPTDDSLPKKRRSLLDIPSRGSSRVDKQSALDTAQEATQDDSDNTLRGSKTSILKGRRDQSRGSSRRSRRADRDVSGVEPKSASTPELDDARPKSGKKSRISIRFLAFLNCCTASSINAEDSLLSPPKKTQPQTVPDRQPAPAVDKTSVRPSDSDTAEPKESPYSLSEKPNPAISSDQSGTHVEYERCTDSQDGAALVDDTSLGADQTVSDHEKPPSVEDSGTSDPSHSDPAKPKAAVVAVGTFQTEDTDTAPSVTDSKSEETIEKDQAVPEPSLSEDTKDGGKDLEGPTGLPFVLPHPPPQIANQEGQQQWLLPPRLPHLQNRKCLVLDLDETLVHSSFKVLERADFTIPVEIEGQYHNIYVIKRPGVDQFMKRVGELYEVVVFTASVSKLDIHNVVHHRLFRDSCYNHQGNYVKDLSQVGRDLQETIIIDNSPTSYIFHPQHAIPISSWFSDAHDNELLDLIPVLEDLASSQVKDVSLVLDIAL